MKMTPGVGAGPGEGGVLGQETVAGMDGVGIGLGGHFQDAVLPQVGLAGFRRAR